MSLAKLVGLRDVLMGLTADRVGGTSGFGFARWDSPFGCVREWVDWWIASEHPFFFVAGGRKRRHGSIGRWLGDRLVDGGELTFVSGGSGVCECVWVYATAFTIGKRWEVHRLFLVFSCTRLKNVKSVSVEGCLSVREVQNGKGIFPESTGMGRPLCSSHSLCWIT